MVLWQAWPKAVLNNKRQNKRMCTNTKVREQSRAAQEGFLKLQLAAVLIRQVPRSCPALTF